MASGWICKGIAKDGKQHPNQNPPGEHEPYENFGSDCVICNLEKTQVLGGASSGGALPTKGIAIAAALLLAVGIGGWGATRQCPPGESKSLLVLCSSSDDPPNPDPGSEPNPNPTPDNTDLRQGLYDWDPGRFSWGNRTLFAGLGNRPRDEGIESFKKGDFQAASESFARAVDGDRNDPEVLIFENNALARAKGDPFTLAAVVPANNRLKSAQEMLRGVAMAQDQFNASGGIEGRLLEIVIANDGNDPGDAGQVAQALIEDDSILGVVGHNSSSASEAGLAEYEQADLAMISPTSTSTSLIGDTFFRTVPSDAAAGERLAQYVISEVGLDKTVVFYNPNSSFSESLQASFEERFAELGGEAIIVDISDSGFDAGIAISTAALQDQTKAALLFPNTDYTSVAIEIARANAKLPEAQKLELFGGDSLYGIDTLTAGGESVEGLIIAVPWFASSPAVADFSNRGQQQWGGPVNWRTAMSFDATQAFISALSPSASRDSVLEGLREVSLAANETSGEAFSFTVDGERQSDPILVEVVRGSVNQVPGSEFGYELLSE